MMEQVFFMFLPLHCCTCNVWGFLLITTCGFSGVTKIVNCEIAYCTLDDVDIFGMHCRYTVKPGKDIYVPVQFSDYEFNLKNGELDVSFRNPSKVWRFNKMTLAEFLEKYWKS